MKVFKQLVLCNNSFSLWQTLCFDQLWRIFASPILTLNWSSDIFPSNSEHSIHMFHWKSEIRWVSIRKSTEWHRNWMWSNIHNRIYNSSDILNCYICQKSRDPHVWPNSLSITHRKSHGITGNANLATIHSKCSPKTATPLFSLQCAMTQSTPISFNWKNERIFLNG